MNTSIAIRTQLFAAALAVVVLDMGVAHAATVSRLGDEASGSLGAGPLASGEQGCFDPQSWVWRAPRAERFTVAIDADGACEIGSADCQRRPESLPPEELTSAYESAALMCALKRAQHDKAEGEQPFDNKSCFGSELALWTVEEAPEQRPFEGLSCSEEDPECRSMPPRPPTHDVSSTASSANCSAGSPRKAPAVALPSAAQVEGGERPGVRRRVERPPTS